MTGRHDNTGEGAVKGLVNAATTLAQDMEAFDALGPRTRAVLNYEMGLAFSAVHVLMYFEVVMRKDPLDQKADAEMARFLMEKNAEIMREIAVVDKPVNGNLAAS